MSLDVTLAASNMKSYIPAQLNTAQVKDKTTKPAEEKKSGAGKKEEPGTSGYSDTSLLVSQPINYNQYNQNVLDNIASMLEGRWKIIENLMNSLWSVKDDKKEEEKIDERKYLEKKDLARADEKMRFAAKVARNAVDDIQSLLAILSKPTANPGARAGMVLAEIMRIQGGVAAAMDQVKEAKAVLKDTNPTDPAMQDQKDKMMKTLDALGNILDAIDKSCKTIKNDIEK